MLSLHDILKNNNYDINDNQNTCNICSLELKPDDTQIIKLECSHEYHYDCIYNWYKKTIEKIHCPSSSKNRECPYCREYGGYLPLLDGKKYEKDIHSPSDRNKSKLKVKKIVDIGIATVQCKGVTKKGTQCKIKFIKKDSDFCYRHKSSD